MPTYERATVLPVVFERVWDLYGDPSGFQVLTPKWVGLEGPAVETPSGEPVDGEYEVGTVMEIRIRPFGIDAIPPQELTVEITECEVEPDRAHFVDEQVPGEGPFETWRHTHRFIATDDDETLLYDHVEYHLPVVDTLPLATPLLAVLFWHRHRRTRALLCD